VYEARELVYFCIMSNASPAVVPKDTQIDDILVQFWNTEASAVVRRQSLGAPRIIGRSGVISHLKVGSVVPNFDISPDLDQFTSDEDSVIRLEMDMDTLTRLSLDIVFLPGI
jgi:hypothetical protein